MFLSSDEIPTPLERVTQGADVFLTKLDPLSDARDRFEDLQFAIEFRGWRVLNYRQFQEAVDLEDVVYGMLQCLFRLRGTQMGSAAEGEALSDLYAAAVKLKDLSSRDSSEAGRHSLTATSPRLGTVGAPLSLSAFELHGAAPDARSLLVHKLITELEQVRADSFPLEFRRFSAPMSVSSLRDIRHVLTATEPHRAEPRTWKILISGARLEEAGPMLDLINEHWEVAGWDVSQPISTWNHYGWEIHTDTTFAKLTLASHVDKMLSDFHWVISTATQSQMIDTPLISYMVNRTVRTLNEAHGQYFDFEVLKLPAAARKIKVHGQFLQHSLDCKHDWWLPSLVEDALNLITSVREGQVHFTID